MNSVEYVSSGFKVVLVLPGSSYQLQYNEILEASTHIGNGIYSLLLRVGFAYASPPPSEEVIYKAQIV